MNLRYLRHILTVWQNFRQRKAMHRAMPMLRELDRLEAEYRRDHRRGSAAIARARREAVHSALAGKAR